MILKHCEPTLKRQRLPHHLRRALDAATITRILVSSHRPIALAHFTSVVVVLDCHAELRKRRIARFLRSLLAARAEATWNVDWISLLFAVVFVLSFVTNSFVNKEHHSVVEHQN